MPKQFLSLLLACCFVTPVLAADQSSAKDLFYDQIDEPSQSINTGVKYWIELRRNGVKSIVDSRTTFKAGDQLRFRILPNVTGYAYVALVRGSTGKQDVLFPNASVANNKVSQGKLCMIPASGFFQFDNHPGTETLKIVVSRNPVDASALLQTDTPWTDVPDHKITPVVKNNSLVAFPEDENRLLALADPAAKGVEDESYSKDLFYTPAKPAVHHIHHHASTSHQGKRPAAHRAVQVSQTELPGTIIINMTPTENLAASIALKHG